MLTATLNEDGKKVDLVGQQGTTWDLRIEVFEDDENTTPMDLSNYSARAQFRKDYKLTSPIIIEFDCEVDLAGDHNGVTLHVDPEVSAEALVYHGVYDVEVYTPDDVDVKRIMQGSLVIDREVTK